MTRYLLVVAVFALSVSTISVNTMAQSKQARACPAKGWITCVAWCNKWRGGSKMCSHTHPESCMNKYGSLTACVKDGPPRS